MKRQHMHVYYNKQLIVIETNMAWAIPYWEERRRLDKKVTYEIVEAP